MSILTTNKIYKYIKKILKTVLKYIVYYFPIKKNKIVFCSFLGKGYCDNPKYIAEEIIRQNLDYELIWITSDTGLDFPDKIKAVHIASLRAFYEWSTAKLWIDNERNTPRPKKKKNQFYLHTWHAPFTLKFIEKDAEDKLDKEYADRAKYDGSITDAIIVNSENQKKQFERTFWLNNKTEYLCVGLPRNDVLINNCRNSILIEKIRDSLQIDSSEYVVLYAPTFRDDWSTDVYIKNFSGIINAFETKTKKTVRVIVRFHPNVDYLKDLKFDSRVINCTSYKDLQELVLISDCVISDYSTTVFDFAILNKAIFLFVPDIDIYKQKRGLLPEFYDLPFPISYNEEELVQTIRDFVYSDYQNNLKQYFEKNVLFDKGDASSKTVDWIKSKLN